jgi:hypothetical protein
MVRDSRPLELGRKHDARVAGVEPVGDAPAGLVEHCILTPDRPLTGETQ